MERTEIIKRAIIDRLGDNVEFFSSDDILEVAGIMHEQLEQVLAEITKISTDPSYMPDKKKPKRGSRKKSI